MSISGVIPQLRTTNLTDSIRFYTTKLGLTLEFQYQGFYAGIRAGSQLFHLKLVDEKALLSISWRTVNISISTWKPPTRKRQPALCNKTVFAW